MGGYCGTMKNVPNSWTWDDVKNELLQVLVENKDYDDGSYGPIFIRLAWHSSGTYDAKTKTGGSNGATMRFSPESEDPENAGLDVARKVLEKVYKKFPGISYSDLWIFAAYVFIEQSGGPTIEFTPGRVDKAEEESNIENGRLPQAEFGVEGESMKVDEEGRICGWEKNAQHVKEIFTRMGFNTQEAVALLCGGHLYGRCHRERSGYHGPWIEEPITFSNEYAADMIEDEWRLVNNDSQVRGCPVHDAVRPVKGKKQYIRVIPEEEGSMKDEAGQQMMLVTDMVLKWDKEFFPYLEKYADEENGEEALKEDFGKAFKKLTELGFV